MQVNANSSTGRKKWRVHRYQDTFLEVQYLIADGHDFYYAHNITGASPAYVEALVEELNIHINEMLYNLGRIARV